MLRNLWGEAAFFLLYCRDVSSRGGVRDRIVYMTAPPVASFEPGAAFVRVE